MTMDQAVQRVVAGKMTLTEACKAMRGTCTVAQLLSAVTDARKARAEKIGKKEAGR